MTYQNITYLNVLLAILALDLMVSIVSYMLLFILNKIHLLIFRKNINSIKPIILYGFCEILSIVIIASFIYRIM